MEDPRVLELPNDNLVIGMTAVVRDNKGVPLPFPAVVKIDSHHTWTSELPPFLFIGTFGPGKNLTPIDNHAFLFRPDNIDYHHKLLVFSIHRQVPEKASDIIFSQNLEWAQWKIGTTMPPIWIDDTEALLLIHGISIEQNTGRYIYSIGRAKLTKNGHEFTVEVASDPIITPDNFLKENGIPMIPELHPDIRRVVYCCGGVLDHSKEYLLLYVNVGDRATFEVKFRLTDLKEGLF